MDASFHGGGREPETVRTEGTKGAPPAGDSHGGGLPAGARTTEPQAQNEAPTDEGRARREAPTDPARGGTTGPTDPTPAKPNPL